MRWTVLSRLGLLATLTTIAGTTSACSSDPCIDDGVPRGGAKCLDIASDESGETAPTSDDGAEGMTATVGDGDGDGDGTTGDGTTGDGTTGDGDGATGDGDGATGDGDGATGDGDGATGDGDGATGDGDGATGDGDGTSGDGDGTSGDGDGDGGMLWCNDVDQDGFGDPLDCQTTMTPPAGWVMDDTDCDDASEDTFPGAAPNDDAAACMKDVDRDDWGDSDPANPNVTAGTDCDDVSVSTFPGAAPNDDAAACMKDTDDDDFGDSTPTNTDVTPGSDCDDGDAGSATTCSGVLWCADTDLDGFGDPDVCQLVDPGGPAPGGYVMDSSDCDDSNVNTFPGAAPNDDAAACMNDDDGDDWGDADPGRAGVIPGTDCDDADAASAGGCAAMETVWADTDGDGYGDPGSSTTIPLGDPLPAGFVRNADDCDDASNTTYPGAAPRDDAMACMNDDDGDDLGDAAPGVAGVVAGTDCDDTDVSVTTGCAPMWCADVDGDGFGDPNDCQSTMTPPPGWVMDATDCDDLSLDTFPGSAPNDDPAACMKDTDDDDWGDASPLNPNVSAGTDCDDADAAAFVGAAPNDDPTACMKDTDDDDWGDDSPPNASVTPGTDCDDGDAASATNCSGELWCIDADSDGFGDPASCVVLGTGDPVPPGYVMDDTDCDDGDVDAFPGSAPNDDPAACMKDTDDDDWGDATPTAPGVTPGTDCDDDDNSVSGMCTGMITVWADTDLDGFGDPASSMLIGASDPIPVGYVVNDLDCDDTSNATFPGSSPNDDANACMKDADGDDWGDATPPGGVVPGSDCDDSDNMIGSGCQPQYCLDLDLDGFGDPADCQSGPGPGRVPNADDCDDADPFTYVGAAPNDDPLACMTDMDADDWGDDAPTSPAAVAGTDCDDTDVSTFVGAAPNDDPNACMKDTDDDDWGDDSPVNAGVTAGTDCDDMSITTFVGSAPNDDALLCMKDTDDDDWGDSMPPGGVDPGTDCDDADAGVGTGCGPMYCVDTDLDGFGDPNDCQSAPGPGRVPNDTDCDDGDGDTFPGSAPNDDPLACMKDTDDDDWGDSNPPAGVVAGTDCDDTDADTFVGAAPNDDPTACMKDTDGDDWGDDNAPAGVTDGTDCDDSDLNTFVGAAPLDDPNACMKDTDGDDWGDDNAPGGVTDGTDCDDTRADTFVGAAPNDDPNACMKDSDGDDWGDDNPANGNVDVGTDCDDGDADAWPGSAPNDDPNACMLDADGDDWGDANPANPLVTAGTDCDDMDPDVFVGSAPNDDPNACMRDVDDDDWGDDTVPPWVVPGTDCDDMDADTFVGSAPNDDANACMKDTDDDDWGDATPPNDAVPGTDCDDANAGVGVCPVYCLDSDSDGWGDPAMCMGSPGAGYVPNDGDCDDSDPFTHPGAAPNDDPLACMTDVDDDNWGDSSPTSPGATAGTDCDDRDPLQYLICLTVTATPENILLGQSSDLLVVANGGTGPGTYSYAWSPVGTLDDPTIDAPLATPAMTTTYDVLVTDGNGDWAAGFVTVHVTDVPLDLATCNPTGLSVIGSTNPVTSWAFNAGNTEACQQNNAEPSVLICEDITLTNSHFEARVEVQTTNDNDVIGFVWGWQDREHYYIFQWKQSAQSFGACGNVNAPQGMWIKKVDAVAPPLDCTDILTVQDTANATLLAAGSVDIPPAGGNGWADNQEYIFEVDHAPTDFTVTVTNATTLAVVASVNVVDDSYPSGAFGGYNYSQIDHCYWDVTTSALP